MNERNKHYLEIYLAESMNDINKKIDFFSAITNCLFELANNPFEKEIKIKFHQQVLETKAYRLAFANHSIISLIKGSRVRILENEVNSIDIDSLYSITRMQIETFLILFYLVFDDVDEEMKNFRLIIYKLHALQKQKGFKLSSNFKDTKNQLMKIDEEINENILKIKESGLFKKATSAKQKEYLKPRYAKIIDSKELFERSGIQKSRLDQMWSIYSNYAHSEYIGDRQHNYRINNPKSIMNSVSLVLDINKMLTSRLIWNLKSLYKENIEKYDSFNLKDKVQIEMWKEI
jgi:hypothetical protein